MKKIILKLRFGLHVAAFFFINLSQAQHTGDVYVDDKGVMKWGDDQSEAGEDLRQAGRHPTLAATTSTRAPMAPTATPTEPGRDAGSAEARLRAAAATTALPGAVPAPGQTLRTTKPAQPTRAATTTPTTTKTTPRALLGAQRHVGARLDAEGRRWRQARRLWGL